MRVDKVIQGGTASAEVGQGTSQSPAPSQPGRAPGAQQQTGQSPFAADAASQGAVQGPSPVAAVAAAMTTRRFAAIDLGSSSVKILVLEIDGDGREKTLLDKKIGVALGKGLPADGSLPKENQDRAIAGIQELAKAAAAFGINAKDIDLIATAATRNAPNGASFIARIQSEAGVTRARALTGSEEAEIGYLGAIAAVRKESDSFATVDLGGGSFQLAIGTATKKLDGGSTQVGSNVIMEKLLPNQYDAEGKMFLDGAKISAKDFAAADQKLAAMAPMPLDVKLLQGRLLVAIGGVSKFLKAHLGKDVITKAELRAFRQELGAMSIRERVAVVQANKTAKKLEALGIETEQGARDYVVKLPASLTLLLRIIDGIGVDSLRISGSDARHALIGLLQKAKSGS